jgi:hypothetical protein
MHDLDLRYHAMVMRALLRLLLLLSITVLSFQGGIAMAAVHSEGVVQSMPGMTSAQHHQAHQAAGQASPDHCRNADSTAASPSHTKCAACASCCAGASAPPALLPGFHAPLLASSRRGVPEASMTSFVPSTLERPPRGNFA